MVITLITADEIKRGLHSGGSPRPCIISLSFMETW